MNVITTGDGLAEFCAVLATEPFIALDTEFLRENTYWPKLCLIQAAAGPHEAVIDPLAGDLDLAPFLALLADPAIVKVFHAARQDLEIFFKLAGALPANVFDTQIGAMACGLGESIAYDALVAHFLKGSRVDKSHRFTDWSRRPLSADQLAYALADVTHLRDLYPKMRAQLESQGRTAWLADEHAALTDPAIYDTEPDNAWMRLKVRKNGLEYLAVLKVAAAWRERAAQARDVPRGRILKDDGLYEIAEQRPKNAAAYERLRAVPKGFIGSKIGQELAACVAAALADPAAYAPKLDRGPPPPSGVGPTVELLKVLLRQEAERHDVAARLIATAADLELIAAYDDADVPAMQGWRREVFGEKALELKRGRIALTLDRGKVRIVAT
jgi:ribonuclease D